MLFDLILSAIFGAGLHQTRRITEAFPAGWQNIADHSIGGVGLIVAWPYWFKRLHVPNPFLRGWLALVMSLFGIGAGVVLGWLLDDPLGE